MTLSWLPVLLLVGAAAAGCTASDEGGAALVVGPGDAVTLEGVDRVVDSIHVEPGGILFLRGAEVKVRGSVSIGGTLSLNHSELRLWNDGLRLHGGRLAGNDSFLYMDGEMEVEQGELEWQAGKLWIEGVLCNQCSWNLDGTKFTLSEGYPARERTALFILESGRVALHNVSLSTISPLPDFLVGERAELLLLGGWTFANYEGPGHVREAEWFTVNVIRAAGAPAVGVTVAVTAFAGVGETVQADTDENGRALLLVPTQDSTWSLSHAPYTIEVDGALAGVQREPLRPYNNETTVRVP